MNCHQCGAPVNQEINFCSRCGTAIQHLNSLPPQTQPPLQAQQTQAPLQPRQPFQSQPLLHNQQVPLQQPFNPYLSPGRGGLILTFGILSLVCFGAIFGIPAWIMGHADLKQIEAGTISPNAKSSTKTGMILGIIGTGFSALALLFLLAIPVGVSLFNQHSAVDINRSAVIMDINTLSAKAQEYYKKPTPQGGGGNSFYGFTMPTGYGITANGTYSISRGGNSSSIIFQGIGNEIGNDGVNPIKIEAELSNTSAAPEIITLN